MDKYPMSIPLDNSALHFTLLKWQEAKNNIQYNAGEISKSSTHYACGDFFCVRGKLENKRLV